MSEAPAVEPPTGKPAFEDLATAKALTALRLPLIGLPLAALAFAVPTGWLIAAGAGWIGIAVLGIAAVAFLVTTVLALIITGFWIGPAGRLLRAEPWRAASVKVYRPAKGFPRARLVVKEADGTSLSLLAPALPWAAQQILARTGKIWLVGPDDKGWVAIRSTGLAAPLGQARVSTADLSTGYEITVDQPDPAMASLASGDAVLAKVIAMPRKRSRTDMVAPVVLLAFAVFVVVDLLKRGVRADQVGLAVGVFAGTLIIVGFFAWRLYKALYWAKIDRLLSLGPWNAVTAELPEPTRVGRTTVTAQATLADGRIVPVTLPRAGHAIRANIAATGKLWVAGIPADGKQMVTGIPGYPFLNRADFGS
uniref:hypothetical protein n=1 Tax=Actinokineospora globicatena TaxID=103729 RepID=UPI0020A60D57|nr:hypothetical protein [Actinokineospora globicatena]MCP2301166.1 hypothetical protein [Actinokineospora globicatena]GLW77198.1 hypothetical protein Aglo01_16800 [Actinokineospora globicatena]GLW84032.1 hypothetical protein Aglo02_16720 [Actinokineospora globicatena]